MVIAAILGLLVSLGTASSGFCSESLLRYYPGEVLLNEIVAFQPVSGNHFSPDAPQRCGSGQLLERSPRLIRCQFASAGPTATSLNVCDDKLTFCRPMEAKIKVLERAGGQSKSLVKNELLNRDLERTLVPGFVSGPPADLVKEAATRGQPVFVMVSADWCPPCNEAKEYLLSSSTFQKAAQNWFKVYIDGDSLNADAWTSVVPYRYFPSFVLLNAHMQEISRYTGDMSQADFEAWAHENFAWVNDPIVSLLERVLARKAGSLKQKFKDLWSGVNAEQQRRQEERLLDWALARDDRDILQRLLPNADFPKLAGKIASYRLSELERRESLEGKDLKAEKIKILQDLLGQIKAESWAGSLEQLCGLDVETCKPFLAKVPERLNFLNQRTDRLEAEKESAMGDEYYSLSEIYKAIGDQEMLHSFALQCVDHFEALKKKSFLKISRAGHQGMVACLELAKAFDREESLLKNLVEAYPHEPTFLQRMARMLRKNKKLDQALVWVNKAEALAYGYNWINLELLRAEILLDLGKAPEARKVLDDALVQIHLDADQTSRSQSLVARVRDLQAKTQDHVQN